MDDLTVEWEHLPDHPERFFGLEEGYSYKDLKRRYNVFLRRFKPEKYPAEFQRIRSAYETLERQLRYGRTAPAPVPAPSFGEEEEEETEWSAPAPAEDRQSLAALAERVVREDPADLVRELATVSPRPPQIYYAMAVMGDLVEGRSPSAFIDALLEGLQAYPDEPGLLNLVNEYCLRSATDPELPALLRKLGKSLSSDNFYFYTERLWDRLSRTMDFPAWRALLQEVEPAVDDPGDAGRLTFYVHVLRRVLFKADEAWLSEHFARIDERGIELSEFMEFDLVVLDMLKEYAADRDRYLRGPGKPARERLDRILQAFAEFDEREADRTFLQAQQEMVAAPDEVLAAFPPGENLNPLLTPYTLVAAEVQARVGLPEEDEEARGDQDRQRVHEFMNRIERLTDKSLLGSLAGAIGWGYLVATVVVLVVAGWGGWLIGVPFESTAVSVVGLLAVPALYWFVLRKRTLDLLREYIILGWAKRIYAKLWRREALKLMQATNLSCDRLEAEIRGIRDQNITNGDLFVMLLAQDFGLAFLSTALRFAG